MTRLAEENGGESASGSMLEIRRFIGRLSGDKVGLHPVQYEHHQFQGDVKYWASSGSAWEVTVRKSI